MCAFCLCDGRLAIKEQALERVIDDRGDISNKYTTAQHSFSSVHASVSNYLNARDLAGDNIIFSNQSRRWEKIIIKAQPLCLFRLMLNKLLIRGFMAGSVLLIIVGETINVTRARFKSFSRWIDKITTSRKMRNFFEIVQDLMLITQRAVDWIWLNARAIIYYW